MVFMWQDTRASKDETNQTKVASKQGKEVWNYIAWGDSTSEIGTEELYIKHSKCIQIKILWSNKYFNYGVQWDAIMTWIRSRI